MTADPVEPRPTLRLRDGVALMVGMVVGIGVFKAPSLVALRLDDPVIILALWAVGALVMLIGALCYAELASAFPDAGGEYHFLTQAFGPGTGFLFGWGRLFAVQTGAIAAVAFVFGDYAERLIPLGAMGPAFYASAAVIVLTALNIRGTRLSAGLQSVLAAILVASLLGAASLGFLIEPQGAAAPAGPAPAGDLAGALGFAMIFVMLTYGGWNEAAYFSAELHDGRHTVVRVLVAGTATVVLLFLLINAAYLAVLGPAGMRASDAVGADYMRALLGAPGAAAISVIVVIASLTTLNATIFTGARSAYAMARDAALPGRLGDWDRRAQGPVNAHLLQALLSLALIGAGTVTRQGFTTMVEYTAPVFWFFLLLVGVGLFVLRRRGLPANSYRVPLYPLTPLIFCASAAYMLHASLAYTGIGALFGVAVLALGVPVWFYVRRRSGAAEPATPRT